mgnify:CR=1 FL=1
MKLTKSLSVPKFLLFTVALLWTGIVAYLCLIQSSDIPVINIPNLDKCIHTFFHLVFTFVWFLFFYKQLKLDSVFKPLLISFLLSFLFGIGIEILQGLITTTRSADVLDGVANLIGALLAVSLVVVCDKYNILKRIL